MFIEQKPKKEKNIKNPWAKKYSPNYGYFFTLVAFIIIAILVFAFVYFLFLKRSPGQDNKKITQDPAAVDIKPLPDNPDNLNENGRRGNFDLSNLKDEELTFGMYYDPTKIEFDSTIEVYDLPINIKDDVTNYYDISRKINLDPYLDHLNEYGYAITDNLFLHKGGDDFFDINRIIISEKIPLLVTSDLIYYYYDYAWEQTFKEIEKTFFYDNLWDLNSNLYQVALNRYRQLLEEVGLENDKVLEGARQETVYFAVALSLLKPQAGQVNRNENFVDNTKFNAKEEEYYSFVLPNNLFDDVQREVNLIRAANKIVKSPTLLYNKDYRYFSVPVEYRGNARLNNFYICLKWLNNVFPLYYASEDCSDCILDRSDWRINFIASCFLTKDLAGNQLLKNKWAVIYKFISFFSGLRSDLTYLNYDKALREVFGDDYDIIEIFSKNNPNRDDNYTKLQEMIATNQFSALEGGIPRTDDNKPKIGMRLLQDKYWPNNYLFSQLVGEDMLFNGSSDIYGIAASKTACGGPRGPYRCNGISLDIINVLHPIQSTDNYFVANTSYEKYTQKLNILKKQFNAFDYNSWNNNVYWVTLDIMRKLLGYDSNKTPIYTRSDDWKYNRINQAALADWANMHLTADYLAKFDDRNVAGMGLSSVCNEYNYIEPNLEFVEELIKKNNMLIDILFYLKISEKNDEAYLLLNNLNEKLEKISSIIRKELVNERLNVDDCSFITTFAKFYEVQRSGPKVFSVMAGQRPFNYSINGYKTLIVINNFDDKKILTIGPIISYTEM